MTMFSSHSATLVLGTWTASFFFRQLSCPKSVVDPVYEGQGMHKQEKQNENEKNIEPTLTISSERIN